MTSVPCAIASGSNLGDSYAILQGAVDQMAQHAHIKVIRCSSIYQTPPVGPPQPDYLNASILIETDLAPEELLRTLLQIEANFGRVRRERWGPRLLDLDLLLFGDLVLTLPTLQIPHPRMHERAFVLVPLAEVASHWVDPISGKTVAQLVQNVTSKGIQKLPEDEFSLNYPGR